MGTKGLMNTRTWLRLVANVVEEDWDAGGEITHVIVYRSKFDNSYITIGGQESNIRCLVVRGITEQLTHGVGFSPKVNKWYGWSHRAICGFTIGSTCEKGDCHYKPRDVEELKENLYNFWHEPCHTWTKVEQISPTELKVSWQYDNSVPNETLHGAVGGLVHRIRPEDFGRGEWTAKTMEDAKQMAIDFNHGVS